MPVAERFATGRSAFGTRFGRELLGYGGVGRVLSFERKNEPTLLSFKGGACDRYLALSGAGISRCAACSIDLDLFRNSMAGRLVAAKTFFPVLRNPGETERIHG